MPDRPPYRYVRMEDLWTDLPKVAGPIPDTEDAVLRRVAATLTLSDLYDALVEPDESSAVVAPTPDRYGYECPAREASTDPTVPRVGDPLTRDNYREGIEFLYSGEVDIAVGPLAWDECYRTYAFNGLYGITRWHLGSDRLIITALPREPRAARVSHRAYDSTIGDRALHFRSDGYSWNQVADALGLPRTTARGYSVARWLAYRARQRRGDFIRPRGEPRGIRFGIEIEFNAERGGFFDPGEDEIHDEGCHVYECDCGDCTCSAASSEGPREKAVKRAKDAGLDAELEDYNHHVRRVWKMVTDATVSGGEFVSPPLPRTDDGYRQVSAALEAVSEAGGFPGDNQGMHVHHDVSDLNAQGMTRLIRLLRVWQGAIMAAVPEHRWNGNNSYGASLLPGDTWQRLADHAVAGSLRAHRGRGSLGIERYVAFNFDATLAYGTLEFRGLGNTLNASKVNAWIAFTGAVVDYARRGLPIPEPVAGGIDTPAVLAVLREHELMSDAAATKIAEMATPSRRRSALHEMYRIDGSATLYTRPNCELIETGGN